MDTVNTGGSVPHGIQDISTFDASRSALLTIDVQTDLATRGSVAYCSGSIAASLPLAEVVTCYRAAGKPIVHTVRLFHEDGSNAPQPYRKVIEQRGALLAPASSGGELLPGIRPFPTVKLDPEALFSRRLQGLSPTEWAVLKPGFGAFFETRLRLHLERLGVECLVICGFGFVHGVRTTIVEAVDRGFDVILPRNAVAGIHPRGLSECEEMGVAVVDSTDVCTWVTAGRG